MGTSQRWLLAPGNEKLSKSVWHFDLPAGLTCPGRTDLCHSKCYARKGRFNFPQVQERLSWCYEQSKCDDFERRMVNEIYRRGILLVRFHCSGDIYSPGYAEKMIRIVKHSPHCRFWCYTRSWTIRTFDDSLAELASCENMKLWFSADAETGIPMVLPFDTRVAWMQTSWGDQSEEADLLFLDHPLRKKHIPPELLEKICPTETKAGKAKGITCATCSVCWTD